MLTHDSNIYKVDKRQDSSKRAATSMSKQRRDLYSKFLTQKEPLLYQNIPKLSFFDYQGANDYNLMGTYNNPVSRAALVSL